MSSSHASPTPELDRELSALEAKLATLLAHAQALRAANDTLRRDLAAAQERSQSLNSRVEAASQQLDALLVRLATTTQ